MIFVSAGTVSLPFGRLVDKVLALFSEQTDERVVIQSGSYSVVSPKKHFVIRDFFSLEQTIWHYKHADIVISASGEMSAYMACLYSKKKPILVPRLKIYDEHVDDQQVAIAEYFRKKGYAFMVKDVSRLKEMLQRHKNSDFVVRKSPLKSVSWTKTAKQLSILIDRRFNKKKVT